MIWKKCLGLAQPNTSCQLLNSGELLCSKWKFCLFTNGKRSGKLAVCEKKFSPYIFVSSYLVKSILCIQCVIWLFKVFTYSCDLCHMCEIIRYNNAICLIIALCNWKYFIFFWIHICICKLLILEGKDKWSPPPLLPPHHQEMWISEWTSDHCQTEKDFFRNSTKGKKLVRFDWSRNISIK